MPRPTRRLIGGIVGAEDLGAAGDHSIAARRVVVARLLGVRIGARSNEVTFLNQSRDVTGGTVIPFDKGSVGLAGLRVGKQNSAAQRRMASQIYRSNRTLVHEKNPCREHSST